MRRRWFGIALLFALVPPSIAAQWPVRSYMGRDHSKWIESQSSVAALAGTNAAIYAGGEYNISIAKTAVDAVGNLYAIGSQLVTVGSYTAHSVFVTKIDPTGATVYITKLGGKGDDIALGIGLDASGRVFGGGYTTSPDFPLLHALQTETSSQGTTAFVFALDASGSLLWSTYFGGSGVPHGSTGSSVKAVAADAAGNCYIAGTSQLPNLLTTPGAYQTAGNFGTVTEQISNGFVAKFSPTGQLVYSTWLQGNLIDCNFQGCFYMSPRIDAGTAIAVESSGAAYVAGYTDSSDFPVTPGAFQTASPPLCPAGAFCPYTLQFYSAFLTKLKPDGSGLVYSTYLGSLGNSYSPPRDGANKGIALDTAGGAYVAFGTTDVTIPIPFDGGLNTAPSGGSDILLLGVNPAGSALTLATYLGGTGDDFVTGLALDSVGNIYVSGTTNSVDFPDSYGLFPQGSDFVTELNPSASKILFGARLPGGLASQDITLISSSAGAVILAGSSGHLIRLNQFNASAFPSFLGVGNAASGTIDSSLTSNELVTIYGTGIGPAMPVTAVPATLSNSLYAAAYPDSLGGVQVSFNGQLGALFYVSSNQINAAVPYGLASPITMQIVNNGTTIGPVMVAAAGQVPTPGIFRNPDGTAAALNQDGTLNTQANPAHSGSVITIWGTGITSLEDFGGAIPQQSADLTSRGYVSVLAAVYGDSSSFSVLPVTYAGGAPGLSGGVFQINAQLPQAVGNGAALLAIEASGIVSPPAKIYVTP